MEITDVFIDCWPEALRMAIYLAEFSKCESVCFLKNGIETIGARQKLKY